MSSLDDALAALARGEAIVLPTDTVYGVGADPTHSAAVASIFRAKGRPEEKALPVLGATVAALEDVVRFDERAMLLAERFWPGPLTLVLPRAGTFTHDLGGRDASTVAVRIPALPLTLELLQRSGPLAVTSANRSGEPPAHSVEEAREALRDSIDVYLDGGTLTGTPSTVVGLVGAPSVLRPGALSEEDIFSVVRAQDG